MNSPQNLSVVDNDEFKNFINSFDHIVSDIDGTLLYGNIIIPGADEFIKKMRNLGKTVTFITNNGMCSLEDAMKKLEAFDPEDNHVLTPIESVSNYLHSIKFDKDLFVLTGDSAFTDRGFNVVEFEDLDLSSSTNGYEDLLKSSERIKDKIKNIGAVVVYGGIRTSWQKTQAAINILNGNKEALWICGTTDDAGSAGKNLLLIGLKCIIDGIQVCTQRDPIVMAKPSADLKGTIRTINKFKDSKRVLVIGDSILADIGLGVNCDFQSLLVLSGVTDHSEVKNWKHPEEYKPSYYIDNLGALNSRLNEVFFT